MEPHGEHSHPFQLELAFKDPAQFEQISNTMHTDPHVLNPCAIWTELWDIIDSN